MRGNGSPTSMSTTRLPPKLVSSRTRPCRLGADLADDRRARAERMIPEKCERRIARIGGDDRDQPPSQAT